MTPITVFSNERPEPGTAFLSVDCHGRMYLSRHLQKLLAVGRTESVRLYLGYDAAEKRIAIARADAVELPGTAPFKFSGKRSYATCRTFLQRYGLEPKDGSHRYAFAGEEEVWLLFSFDSVSASPIEPEASE